MISLLIDLESGNRFSISFLSIYWGSVKVIYLLGRAAIAPEMELIWLSEGTGEGEEDNLLIATAIFSEKNFTFQPSVAANVISPSLAVLSERKTKIGFSKVGRSEGVIFSYDMYDLQFVWKTLRRREKCDYLGVSVEFCF